MTKEEIIQAITDDKMMPFIQPEQLAEIVDFVIKNYKPSLPSNLDGAAWKYAMLNPDYQMNRLESFKAGAEWMAGQFVLVGGEPTGWFRANDGSEYATGLDLKEPIKLPVDFYVRKK